MKRSPIGLNTRSQFAHLYMASPARARSKRSKEKKWNPAELIDESDRKRKASRHVESPLPPLWLKGSAAGVLRRSTAWHQQAREAGGGAKRRITSPCLAAAVVSWPDDKDGWEEYRSDVVGFFEGRWGDRVCGVVEHKDESHLHSHIFLVAREGEGFGVVHPGYEARRIARALPGNHVGKEFVSAMKRWQDDLHAATGEKHGLARMSVRRASLSRPEYLERRRDAEAKAKAQEAEETKAKEQVSEMLAEAQREIAKIREENYRLKDQLAKETAARMSSVMRDALSEAQSAQSRREQAGGLLANPPIGKQQTAMDRAGDQVALISTSVVPRSTRPKPR